jgi:arginase
MPLAALARLRACRALPDRRVSPTVRPEQTALVGIRNLDAREKELVRAAGVHVFTMKDIDRSGIAAVVEQALAHAGRAQPAYTCRSTWTCAIHPSRPAWGHR